MYNLINLLLTPPLQGHDQKKGSKLKKKTLTRLNIYTCMYGFVIHDVELQDLRSSHINVHMP